MYRPFIRLGLIALTASFVGCATTKPVPSGATSAAPTPTHSTTPYFLAPLDIARIKTSAGDPVSLQISQDGTLDLGGQSVRAQGLPVEKFRTLLRQNYPGAIQIEIVEFRPNRITVLGEVFHQIHTDLGDGPMRVMDAIASANGFTPLANKRRVKLIRENAGDIEVYELDLRQMMLGGDLGQNMLLNPGDVITVPRNFL